jgi:hypothetical protein
MGMKGEITIVAHIFLVDSQHLGRTMFHEKLQGIVNRSLRQGWNIITQGQVNLFNGRMSTVRQQVIHNGQALYGWLDIKT